MSPVGEQRATKTEPSPAGAHPIHLHHAEMQALSQSAREEWNPSTAACVRFRPPAVLFARIRPKGVRERQTALTPWLNSCWSAHPAASLLEPDTRLLDVSAGSLDTLLRVCRDIANDRFAAR